MVRAREESQKRKVEKKRSTKRCEEKVRGEKVQVGENVANELLCFSNDWHIFERMYKVHHVRTTIGS